MKHIIALIGVFFSYACAAPAAEAEPDFDVCLMTNMAAVQMLEENIDKTEEFLTRAKMTQDAYEEIQASLSAERASLENLLSLRADMLRDDTMDAAEQAARNSVLMRNYASGAESAIAKAKANGFSAAVLAERATSCAQGLTD